MTTPNPAHDSDVYAEFGRLLEQARQRLLRIAVTTDEELATLEAHPPGAPMEDAATNLVAELLSRLGAHGKQELDEIEAARARLAAEVFGVCEECGGVIPLARLRALPTTRYCLSCQTRRERAAG